MTSPPSSSRPGPSSAFHRLDERLREWVWDRGWSELRDIQEQAILSILDGSHDLVISAATAGGKTEAAFLPLCTRMAAQRAEGIQVVYVSPLKALINDQSRRLEAMCERIGVPVHRWHGDVDHARKRAAIMKPEGVLLITPESLEALFINRGAAVLESMLDPLMAFVVDELHSFIGTERGCQLQSLLHRTEAVLGRRVRRIGLSATLGDMELAGKYLCPSADPPAELIVSNESRQEVRLQIRGYHQSEQAPAGEPEDDDAEEPLAAGDRLEIAEHLFKTLRQVPSLVFTNRRSDVEAYSDTLRRLCDRARVDNSFYPHHGSLSRELREIAEARLREATRADGSGAPATVICTSTLELGIDIGDMHSIAQIGMPPTVTAMRQRLGRSGRRGEAAILRVYVIEKRLDSRTAPQDALRSELVHTIAEVALMAAQWCEPPRDSALHLSTMVQQVVSSIASYGGCTAADLYSLLCGLGAFRGVSKAIFAALLRSLATHDLIKQTGDGELVLGMAGERAVNHHSFYAAFSTPDEYRLYAGPKLLGTLPISEPQMAGMHIIYAGRRWKILEVDDEGKVLRLEPAAGGRVPVFVGSMMTIAREIRESMREVYESEREPAYVDRTARALLREGRDNYRRLGLQASCLVPDGGATVVFPWTGDREGATLRVQLAARGLRATGDGFALTVDDIAPEGLRPHLEAIRDGAESDAKELALRVETMMTEKHDRYLTTDLLAEDYSHRSLDVEGAREALRRILAAGQVPSAR